MHDIFYFTDIHGARPLFDAIMNYCHEEDDEAMIIFGGDACDRGPDGYKIMKELIANPKILYLMGNHEDMFVKAARFIINNYKGPIDDEYIFQYLYSCSIKDEQCIDIQHCFMNGGYATLRDWMMDGMPKEFVDTIANLPLTFSYENLDFCHAGGDPKIFLKVKDAEYDQKEIEKEDKEMVIWDRNWMGFGWTPDRTCIFGHTPTIHLPAKYYGRDKSTKNVHPCKYVGLIDDRLTGYRIDMDTGMAISGRGYVLNCLTMKAQGFFDKDYKNDLKMNHNVEKIEVIQF